MALFVQRLLPAPFSQLYTTARGSDPPEQGADTHPGGGTQTGNSLMDRGSLERGPLGRKGELKWGKEGDSQRTSRLMENA